MLTAKGKYGLKALVHLAGLPEGQTAQALDIALRNNISKKFLDSILADLRKSGLVLTKKGPGGGYMLAKKPADIGVGNAIRILDGPLAPIACASKMAFQPCSDCLDLKNCAVRITMTRVRDAMSSILDSTNLADMLLMKDAPQQARALSRRSLA